MKELSCGFIIINRKNPKQILACQPNGRRPNTPGNYDIPKGHRENGETTLEAAIRELKEETGFTITDEKTAFILRLDAYACWANAWPGKRVS